MHSIRNRDYEGSIPSFSSGCKMSEIYELQGKKVFSCEGNTVDEHGRYSPLKIVFEGGGTLVVDAGTFQHPEESQTHLLGRHLVDFVNRIKHCVNK